MFLLLFMLAAFVFVALMAVVAMVGLTLGSLATLVVAPGQLVRLLRDKRLRRNHALEHATINVIEERYGPTKLAGLAQPEGFIIRGGASPDLIAAAAQEALRRMRRGERRLAIHPRCGTTLVAAQLIMAIVFLAVLIGTWQISLWPFLAGILAAVVLAPRLSPVLQRYVTTDATMDDVAITGLEIQPASTGFWLVSVLATGPILVRTSHGAVPVSRVEPDAVFTSRGEEIPVSRYRVR